MNIAKEEIKIKLNTTSKNYSFTIETIKPVINNKLKNSDNLFFMAINPKNNINEITNNELLALQDIIKLFNYSTDSCYRNRKSYF